MSRSGPVLSENKLKELIERAIPHSDSKGRHEKLPSMTEYLLKTPLLEDQPPFLEVGTRGGGSAWLTLELMKYMNPDSVLITVDPYGDKPYDNKPWKYGGMFYTRMKKLLAPYPNHIHYQMTSEEFITIMDKIGYWHKGKRKTFSEFSFVFLDGSHLPDNVKLEFDGFFPRLINEGYIVIDNTDFFKGEMNRYFRELAKDKEEMRLIKTGNQTVIRKSQN